MNFDDFIMVLVWVLVCPRPWGCPLEMDYTYLLYFFSLWKYTLIVHAHAISWGQKWQRTRIGKKISCNQQGELARQYLTWEMLILDAETRGFSFNFVMSHLKIIHKRNYPNLATAQREKCKILRILLYFGNLLEPIDNFKKKILQNLATSALLPLPEQSGLCMSRTGFYFLSWSGENIQPKNKLAETQV